MGLLNYIQRKRDRKTFLYVLPPLLRKRFGKCKRYTAEQILSVVTLLNLRRRHLYYAYAMLMPEKDYEASLPDLEIPRPYAQVRRELASAYFRKNTRFTIHDIFDTIQARHLTGIRRLGGVADFNHIIGDI